MFFVLLEVDAEGLVVVVEAEGLHGKEDVVAVDGFAFFVGALLTGLAGDEADELRDTFLHRLLRVLGDLGVVGKRPLHDAADVGDGQEPVLFPHHGRTALSP